MHKHSCITAVSWLKLWALNILLWVCSYFWYVKSFTEGSKTHTIPMYALCFHQSLLRVNHSSPCSCSHHASQFAAFSFKAHLLPLQSFLHLSLLHKPQALVSFANFRALLKYFSLLLTLAYLHSGPLEWCRKYCMMLFKDFRTDLQPGSRALKLGGGTYIHLVVRIGIIVFLSNNPYC